ncbi:hypothetical protein BKA66DRAFT_575596 [Pyrenochaeta sp. MPI-SDFR-AT-0127]|nr:hypothetical protein BKA66DRAFT_575596 [Pyrenochaeta sp. MPI-SDFR-AT-0127]
MSSYQYSSRASRRSSTTVDSSRVLTSSKGAEFEGRLERHRFRKPMPDIATAISPSGWLATSSHEKVRLYNMNELRFSSSAAKKICTTIKCSNEWGKIRAIALSQDMLAIVTYTHLVVFEYAVHGGSDHILIDTKLINPNEAWTPQSVAIRQVDFVGPDEVPFFWIAVGGQGQHGVRVYKYTHRSGYGAQCDRLTLSCPGNTSPVRVVGFSQEQPTVSDSIILFGATDSNWVYCWALSQNSHCRTPDPNWIVNCDARKGGVPHPNAIRSVQIFLAPSMKTYLFCAIDQKHGSQTVRSFIAPLNDANGDQDILLDGCHEMSCDLVGRNVLCGGVSPSGNFIALVEENIMRLLTLQPANSCSLSCVSVPKPLEWRSSLAPTAADISGMSLLVQEEQGILKITGLDGRGTVELRSVNIQDFSPKESPKLLRQWPSATSSQSSIRYELLGDLRGRHEMPADSSLRYELPHGKCRERNLSKPVETSLNVTNSYYSGSIDDSRIEERRFEEVRIERWSQRVPVYQEPYQHEPPNRWNASAPSSPPPPTQSFRENWNT